MAAANGQSPASSKARWRDQGVVNTDMQLHLRAGDPAGFPEQVNFIDLKESGQLTSPDDAAARVLAYLNRADFGATPIGDLRDT